MPWLHHSDGAARLRRKAVGHFGKEGIDFAVSNQVRAEGEHVHRAHIQIFLRRVLVGMEHMPASVLQHGQRIQIGKLMAVCLGHTVIENLPVPNDHARDGLSADAIGVVIRVHPPDSLILFCNQRSLHMLALRFLRVVKNTAHALCVQVAINLHFIPRQNGLLIEKAVDADDEGWRCVKPNARVVVFINVLAGERIAVCIQRRLCHGPRDVGLDLVVNGRGR